MRGALNLLSTLDDGGAPARRRGRLGRATTPSAWPSPPRGSGATVRATLFVPRTAPRAKVEKLRRFPVEVRETGETYDDAVEAARAFERETGARLRPRLRGRAHGRRPGHGRPRGPRRVPRGRRRCSCPVGGGGLIAGMATAVKARAPDVRVVAVQPEASPALRESLRLGRPLLDLPGRAHARRRPRRRHRRDRLRPPRPRGRGRDGERGGDRGRDRGAPRRRPGGGRGLGRGRASPPCARGRWRAPAAGRWSRSSPAATSTRACSRACSPRATPTEEARGEGRAAARPPLRARGRRRRRGGGRGARRPWRAAGRGRGRPRRRASGGARACAARVGRRAAQAPRRPRPALPREVAGASSLERYDHYERLDPRLARPLRGRRADLPRREAHHRRRRRGHRRAAPPRRRLRGDAERRAGPTTSGTS